MANYRNIFIAYTYLPTKPSIDILPKGLPALLILLG